MNTETQTPSRRRGASNCSAASSCPQWLKDQMEAAKLRPIANAEKVGRQFRAVEAMRLSNAEKLKTKKPPNDELSDGPSKTK